MRDTILQPMSRTIIILRNGQIERTLALKDGTYGIGRDPSAEIVLPDGAVSKSHASLVIDGDIIRIQDMGSVNGIYVQGKRIQKHESRDKFEAEIRPFTLKSDSNEKTPEADAQQKPEAISLAGSLMLSNIKIAIFLLVGVFITVSLIIITWTLNSRLESIKNQESLKNGILLSRYLAEMNRPFLENEDYSRVRVSQVRVEDGVLYAFVVDRHGRIIVPHEQQGDFFNWDGLASAFREPKLTLDTGPDKEQIIFTPIIRGSSILGAAIIGFSPADSASGHKTGLGGAAFFALIILLAFAMSASYFMAGIFLKPLRLLYEEVEVAIKEGRNSIQYSAPFRELENIKNAFNRLLIRRTSLGNSSDPGHQEPIPFKSTYESAKVISESKKPESKNTEAEPSKSSSLAYPDTKYPWCEINADNYSLIRFSENFTADLGLKKCRSGMHVIEAFDSDIIQAVSHILDNSEINEHPIQTPDVSLVVRRISSEQASSRVLIAFEVLNNDR